MRHGRIKKQDRSEKRIVASCKLQCQQQCQQHDKQKKTWDKDQGRSPIVNSVDAAVKWKRAPVCSLQSAASQRPDAGPDDQMTRCMQPTTYKPQTT
mmetsp:Transcript_49234/g.127006  ORF Transcript_49234/g.127006 Transcript_49234/m.127006 type:complete len:96 (+) Transcript_49234:49-336(+)